METYIFDKSGVPVIQKDAGAELDYTFDWEAWLLAISDAISSYEVSVDAGITKVRESRDGAAITVWVMGGWPGNSHRVKCKITTASGRIEIRTIRIHINT